MRGIESHQVRRKKPQWQTIFGRFCMIQSQAERQPCSQSRFEDSNDASRISAPLRPKLAQTNKVEPRSKIANVDVGTENDDVIH